MSVLCAATTSRLNGLREVVAPCTFPKSIARRGSPFSSYERRFWQVSDRFSIVLKCSGRTHRARIIREYQNDSRSSASDAFRPWCPRPEPFQIAHARIRSQTSRPPWNTPGRAVALGRPAGVGGLGFPLDALKWATDRAL